MKRLFRHPRVLAALAWVLGAYLRFALWTTRWTVQGAEVLGEHLYSKPLITAFWHERLPVMPALWQYAMAARSDAGRVRGRVYVLVSRHRDGHFIGDLIRAFHLDVVRGSSAKRGEQKGGAAGLRALLGVLSGGNTVAITPDGPRGPRRRLERGVGQLAAISGAPVLPCAGQVRWHWTMPTWDRMTLPLPFSRGVLVCRPLIDVPREGWEAVLPAIEAALNEAADQADRACRA